MQYAKILGSGSYLPEKRVSNDDLAEFVDTSDEWIVSRTGIKFRHLAAENERTSDLAVIAAQRALADAGVAAEEIDLIVLATATPDMQFPSTATIVQNKLGIAGCAAFDVQAVCAGFMYAIVTANAYIKSGMAKKVLVIGAETLSHILDWKDRTTCVLFGDGAGAVVLGASDEEGIIHGKLQADGGYLDLLKVPAQMAGGQICGNPYVEMDGPGVFKFAVKTLAKVAEEAHHRQHRQTSGSEPGQSHPDRAKPRQYFGRIRSVGIGRRHQKRPHQARTDIAAGRHRRRFYLGGGIVKILIGKI